MAREEREALEQRSGNFYYESAKTSLKTTVNYFKKQNVPQSTRHYVLQKYSQYETTKDLSWNARPLKLSKKNLKNIVKFVNNRCGLSQRKLARRFKVHYSTISRNLRRRTSIVIRKRSKWSSEQQKVRVRKNYAKLYWNYWMAGIQLWTMRNTSKRLETTSLEITNSIKPIQLQLLQTSTSNVEAKNSPPDKGQNLSPLGIRWKSYISKAHFSAHMLVDFLFSKGLSRESTANHVLNSLWWIIMILGISWQLLKYLLFVLKCCFKVYQKMEQNVLYKMV